MSLYNGPVTILRRNRDEIMQKNPQITSQNRANNLLMAFLEQRYPHLLTKPNKDLLNKGLAIGRQRDFDHWIGTVFTQISRTDVDSLALLSLVFKRGKMFMEVVTMPSQLSNPIWKANEIPI